MLVMKFGGTSVGCAASIARACDIVRDRLHRHPVVVVSALARVTDQLQSAGSLSRKGQLAEALQILASIEERHAEIARELLPAAHCELLEKVLQPSFRDAHALLRAIAAIGELTSRTNDRLLGLGERWSSVLVAEMFRSRGLPAIHIDASEIVITDSSYSCATPCISEIENRATVRLLPLVEKLAIPILGGFIGASAEGVPTTLGRGGSDFTASILGAALAAESIEIWTDVDGMMTADPRICPDAQNIDSISFEEAAELAHFGAKVLHPQTLQPAVELGIPVYVLNSRHPERRGTRVEVSQKEAESRLRSIACKRGIVLAEVFAKQGLDARLTASIFEAVEQQSCLMDLAAMSRSNLSLLLNSESSAAELATILEGSATVKITPGVALVSLVGRNVARDAAISARALGVLPQFDVKMIFHGASDMNLSFAVAESDAEAVVRSLHQELFTHAPAEPELLNAHYQFQGALSDAVEA